MFRSMQRRAVEHIENRRLAVGLRSTALLFAVAFLAAGCGGSSVAAPFPAASPADFEELQLRIDRMTLAGPSGGPPGVDRNTPWEIVHVGLGWGFQTKTTGGNARTVEQFLFNAPEFLGDALYVRSTAGWQVRQETSINRFESHACEFLACYAMGGIPADRSIFPAPDTQIRVRDLIDAAKADYYSGRYPAFLIIALAIYEREGEPWAGRGGVRHSLKDLVERLIAIPVEDQTCGGSHGFLALAIASRWLCERKQPLDDSLALKLNDLLQTQTKRCLESQHPDGFLSPDLFQLGRSAGVGARLYVTGHCMEWICASVPEDQLRDPRILKSLFWLERSLQSPTNASLGDVGHAMHALRTWRERIRGL